MSAGSTARSELEQAGKVADESIPSATLDEFIGYNLKRAYIHIDADFRRSMEAEKLSPRVFSTLALVADNPGISQSDVARLLGIERSGLVAIIDDLEKRGLLRREVQKSDRRVQALVPTAKGSATYRRSLSVIAAHEDSMLEMLTTEERSALLALLKKIRHHIEDAL